MIIGMMVNQTIIKHRRDEFVKNIFSKLQALNEEATK